MSFPVRALCLAAAVGFLILLLLGVRDLADLGDGRKACQTVPYDRQQICRAGVQSIYGQASEDRFALEVAFAGLLTVGALVVWQVDKRKPAV